MNDPVTWGALAFIAGIIAASVGWATAFWLLIPSRMEFNALAARVRELEMK